MNEKEKKLQMINEIADSTSADQLEITLENLRHEVPGGPHVECVAIAAVDPGNAARSVVHVNNFYFISAVGQQQTGSHAVNTGADDYYCFSLHKGSVAAYYA